jgi:hypothetical protein
MIVAARPRRLLRGRLTLEARERLVKDDLKPFVRRHAASSSRNAVNDAREAAPFTPT